MLWNRCQICGAAVASRWTAFGLVKGAADLIGLVKPHGRFLALEVKSRTGRASKEQIQFLALVNRMGGVGGIVRSVEEALELVTRAAEPAEPAAAGGTARPSSTTR